MKHKTSELTGALLDAAVARPKQSRPLKGSTALIAAMRAYVASKLGEEVDL